MKLGLYSVTVIKKLYKIPKVIHVGQYIACNEARAERKARKEAGVDYGVGIICEIRQLEWDHRATYI